MDSKLQDKLNTGKNHGTTAEPQKTKLQLNRETVRQLEVLDTEDLAGVAGAGITVYSHHVIIIC